MQPLGATDPSRIRTGRPDAERGLTMSASGVDAFSALGRTLEDSPLKDAVARLVNRRRSGG